MNIDSIKQELLAKLPFYANIVNNTNFIENNSIPTVATNGKDIFYNSDFIQNINEEQRIFAFANVVCHIAFDDLKRGKDKDQTLWNIATDAVINNFLRQNGFTSIENAVDMPEASNYDAEEMYKIVLEQKNNGSITIRDSESSAKKR